jgi:hypothetical protein
MKLWKKLLIVLLCVMVILVVVVTVFYSTGGMFVGCSDEVVSRTISSGKQYEASLVTKDCGATTSSATHLSVLRSGSGISESLFIIENHSPVNIEWISPKDIKVTFSKKDKEAIFKQVNEWHDIQVLYEQLN